ncbi:MAG: HAMP domain-containing sensor histidine kinase [Planctomycetales bacterium]
MRSGGIKELFGTLRFRLTFWNSLVVFSSILIALFVVQISMQLALWHEADSQLGDDAQEIRQIVESLYPDRQQIFQELEIKARTHQHREFFVRLFDEHNAPLWSNNQAPSHVSPPPDKPEAGRISQVDNYHLTHIALDKSGVPHWKVQVGASLSAVNLELQQLRRMLLLVGGLSLVIAPLGGYWLSHRATQPLRQIMDTTARLHPSDLNERLPIRGTRDELDRLSITINGFLDRIARYLAQNREFTANAAHELRSPLAAIQSSIEVALNAERDSDQYKEFLSDILEECAGLTKLVNQLLLLAESDSDRLKLHQESCNLRRLVEKACEMFAGTAESKDVAIKFVCKSGNFIPADTARLRQVINNLIDNALKYSPPNSEINVELAEATNRNYVMFSVTDHGPGIPIEDLPHIFERFYVGNKSRSHDGNGRGTGLGLSICQSIVKSHGGLITAESQPGQGATFRVYLRKKAFDGIKPLGDIVADTEDSNPLAQSGA